MENGLLGFWSLSPNCYKAGEQWCWKNNNGTHLWHILQHSLIVSKFALMWLFCSKKKKKNPLLYIYFVFLSFPLVFHCSWPLPFSLLEISQNQHFSIGKDILSSITLIATIVPKPLFAFVTLFDFWCKNIYFRHWFCLFDHWILFQKLFLIQVCD